MHFLFLSISCSVLILVIFKLMAYYKAKSFEVIVINYLTGSVLAFFACYSQLSTGKSQFQTILIPALITGLLFISNFYVMSRTIAKTGITVTAIFARMSVIIPVTFSILYFNEKISLMKITGILVSVMAIVLSIWKKEEKKIPVVFFIFPVFTFLVSGITDSFLKYIQHFYLRDSNMISYSFYVFVIASIAGILIYILSGRNLRELFRPVHLLFGILLGFANLGALIFFINALNHTGLDSSVVFGINHQSIIALSVLIAFFVFHEKPRPINWVGILAAMAGIYILFNA